MRKNPSKVGEVPVAISICKIHFILLLMGLGHAIKAEGYCIDTGLAYLNSAEGSP